MKIASISEIDISINFKLKFKHNTKSRDKTESFFVKIVTDSGMIGYGEGCPRSYVTGEDLKSCRKFLSEYENSIAKLTNLDELKIFVELNNKAISKSPSAWCAIEIALLDLLAKEKSISVEEMFELNPPIQNHSITAVIGIDSPFLFLKKLMKYRFFGLSDFKLKLTGVKKIDKRILSWVKFSGIPSKHVRVDANNIWSDESECIAALKELDNLIWAIEEPLQERDIKKFIKISKETGKKIILDESFLKVEDFEEIKSHPDIFLVNLRISKMGGIIRSLGIISAFKKHGFKFILGTHVGETSLLGRVSLFIAENFKESIYAMEGSYSTHLLEVDPANPNIKFGKKGLVKVNDLHLKKSGWGIDFNE
ncbi:hypothetical protein A9Q84_06240 [Halobacteriovorax marinus]|uniref:Mandelate racemase/muconate lactonizing enzyme C-terminal domain-containing protein n=1 Tax=Halobacteriovorax marinus TaxID=97084 RepID=A0A1Y5F9J8_9BACT|nr:hypothetical protein A9Q84_06240 [Halobacteriovorax marinus]